MGTNSGNVSVVDNYTFRIIQCDHIFQGAFEVVSFFSIHLFRIDIRKPRAILSMFKSSSPQRMKM